MTFWSKKPVSDALWDDFDIPPFLNHKSRVDAVNSIGNITQNVVWLEANECVGAEVNKRKKNKSTITAGEEKMQ